MKFFYGTTADSKWLAKQSVRLAYGLGNEQFNKLGDHGTKWTYTEQVWLWWGDV